MLTSRQRDEDVRANRNVVTRRPAPRRRPHQVIRPAKAHHGNPDLESISIRTGSSSCPSPRIVSSAIVADNGLPALRGDFFGPAADGGRQNPRWCA